MCPRFFFIENLHFLGKLKVNSKGWGDMKKSVWCWLSVGEREGGGRIPRLQDKSCYTA